MCPQHGFLLLPLLGKSFLTYPQGLSPLKVTSSEGPSLITPDKIDAWALYPLVLLYCP